MVLVVVDIVFLLLLTGQVQVEAQYTCQCKFSCPGNLPYSPAEPCPEGSCRPGYFDDYCQTKNVAQGKKAWQISTYSHYLNRVGNIFKKWIPNTPDKAVDGNTNGFYSRRSCTHTGLNETAPYWTVDLGQIYTVYKIIIYQRTTLLERLTGFEIKVDNNFCYRWGSQDAPPIRIPLSCQQPIRGRNVTVRLPRRNDGANQILTLCEVLVLVCNDYWFGERCDRTCHCRDPMEVCHPISGHCNSGCASGYIGDNCQQKNGEKPKQIGRVTLPPTSDSTSPGDGGHLSSGDITAIFFGVVIAIFTLTASVFIYRWWRLGKRSSATENRYDDLIRRPTTTEHLYVGMSEVTQSEVKTNSDKDARFTISDDHYEYVGGHDGYLEPVSPPEPAK